MDINNQNNGNGHIGHNHSTVLTSILPIDELICAGRGLQSLDKVQEYARPVARAVRHTAYNPAQNPDDREHEDDHQRDLTLLPDVELAAANAQINVKEGERKAAELQKGMQEPKFPVKIAAVAIGVISISLGPTLHDQFFHTMDDQVVAWVFAMACGAVIGALITWSIARGEAPNGNRGVLNFAGLLGGLAIGICGLLLRLAVGDLIVGFATTILEFGAIALLELTAAPLREKHREFVAAHAAHTQATSVLKSLNDEAARRNQQLDEIHRRLEKHKAYLALRTYCCEKFSEIEEAAVQIATKAFLEKQAEQQLQLDQAKKRLLGL